MSRKPQTEEEQRFARLVGQKLDEAIEAQDLTRDEAADRLGIHRSMLYRYLAGKSIPGSKVLQRACEELGVTVDYRGFTIDANYYKGEEPVVKQPRSIATQIPLFSRESFSSEFAQVDIRKKHASADTIELRVALRLGRTFSNRH
jgi:transcriptional regulator with XRE-family HTH domain